MTIRTKASRSKKAAAKREIDQRDTEPFDEPEEPGEECSICGELVNPACLLFIGTNGKGQALFACGDCCCSNCEDG